MYECCEIQNKRNWGIRIETAVRALHFEMSYLNNAHENASAITNNIANQVVEDRNRCGRAKLEFLPGGVYQRPCRGIRVAIAQVSCERCGRTGKSCMFYLFFSQSASL